MLCLDLLLSFILSARITSPSTNGWQMEAFSSRHGLGGRSLIFRETFRLLQVLVSSSGGPRGRGVCGRSLQMSQTLAVYKGHAKDMIMRSILISGLCSCLVAKIIQYTFLRA